MQKMNRIDLWFLFLLFFCSEFSLIRNTHAEMSYLQMKGVHDVIRPEYHYLSPIHGFTALKTGALANFRFYGMFGEQNPKFPCDERFLKKNDCPQDAFSFILQRLFPSPDGFNFVANQVPSDVFSKLKPSTIGKVLGELSLQDPFQLGNSTEKSRLIERLIEITYQDSNPDGFKQNTINVRRKISQYKNTIREMKAIDSTLKSCPPEMRSQLNTRMNELTNVLKELEPEVVIRRRDLLKKQNLWKELAPFFEALVEAWQQNQSNTSFYPSHSVEKALLAYFWVKQNHKQDYLELFKGMPHIVKNEKVYLIEDLETTSGQQNQWLNQTYLFQDYIEWKSRFRNENPTPEQILEIEQNPEFSSFLAYSFHFVDRMLPPLLVYGDAAHKSLGRALGSRKYQVYPDCGETSLRNFFNILLFDKQSNSLNPEILIAVAEKHQLTLYSKISKNQKEKGLLGFYRRNRSLDTITDDGVRDDWSRRVVSGHSSVTYKKPKEEAEQSSVCEIKSGVTNLLNVIEELLGDSQEVNSLAQISKNGNDLLISASKKFDRICELFSRSDFHLDWRVKYQGNKKILADRGIELEFLINGTPTFSWEILNGHTLIRDLSEQESDWRVHVGKELASKLTPLSHSAHSSLPWYIHSDNFESIEKAFLSSQTRQEIQHMLYYLPLQSIETKQFALEKLFENFSMDLAFKDVVLKLFSTLPEEDTYSQSRVLNSALKNRLSYVQEIQRKYLENLSTPERKSEAALISAERGYLELLQTLALENIDLNGLDEIDRNLLLLAADQRHWDVVSWLAKHNPQWITEKDRFEDTAFHAVVREKNWHLVQLFAILAPYGLAGKNRDGETPFHLAVTTGSLEVIQFLHYHYPKVLLDKDDSDMTVLHFAAKRGDLSIVEFLYKKSPSALMEKNRRDETPFHLAVSSGNLEVVRFLADKNPNAFLVRDSSENTPLHLAVLTGNLKLVQFLEEKNHADLYKVNDDKMTPLHLAAEAGHLNIVQFLTVQNPDALFECDLFGRIPLHWAVYSGNLDMVQFLTKQNPYALRKKLDDGKTLFHLAAEAGSLEVVQFLNANIPELLNEQNEHGETTLQIAKQLRFKQIVSYLEKLGAHE
jgi:ankyrin repeat protein